MRAIPAIIALVVLFVPYTLSVPHAVNLAARARENRLPPNIASELASLRLSRAPAPTTVVKPASLSKPTLPIEATEAPAQPFDASRRPLRVGIPSHIMAHIDREFDSLRQTSDPDAGAMSSTKAPAARPTSHLLRRMNPFGIQLGVPLQNNPFVHPTASSSIPSSAPISNILRRILPVGMHLGIPLQDNPFNPVNTAAATASTAMPAVSKIPIGLPEEFRHLESFVPPLGVPEPVPSPAMTANSNVAARYNAFISNPLIDLVRGQGPARSVTASPAPTIP